MKNAKLSMFILSGIVFMITMPWGASTTFSAIPSDTLIVAMSTLSEETFLPWNGGGPRSCYLTPIYDFMVYSEPGTEKVLPGLATKWQMSKDGKTWTFWLRQGVQFHEGWGELTAEDVLYTVKRWIAPESKSGTGRQLQGWLDKVEAPERYQVVFHLKTPLADLPAAFLVNNMQFTVVCKKYVETVGDEKANSHPIGTGPYAFVEHKRGISIRLTTIDGVEKHWRVTPQFKNIIFLNTPEESTRVAMLRTGEVDLVPISYDSVETIKALGFNIISIPKNWAPTIKLGGLVMTDPKRFSPNNPWADKRVRQALNYAIDKEAIMKQIFHGEASVTGAGQLLPEWFDIKPYPYDPVKAKQLLTDAGYSKGFSINLKTYPLTPGAELPIIGQAVTMFWNQIGIDVKIFPTDYGTVRSEWIGGKALGYAWTHRGLPFPSVAIGIQLEHTAAMNFASFVTEETEKMVIDIMKEIDLKKRSTLVREMGEYLRDEASAVFIGFANEPYAVSKRVAKWPTIRQYPTNMEYVTLR